MFIALFVAVLSGFTFHENAYVSGERVLRLYNSNSQIEKIVWRLTLPRNTQCHVKRLVRIGFKT